MKFDLIDLNLNLNFLTQLKKIDSDFKKFCSYCKKLDLSQLSQTSMSLLLKDYSQT